MSNICLKVDNLSKRFFIRKERLTTFGLLKHLASKGYGCREFWALRDISFTLNRGERLAIIGANGSGKTTLVRILSGIYSKTGGQVEFKCDPSVVFSFWIGLNMNLSVMDNIYLFGAVHGMDRNFLKSRVDAILEVAALKDFCFSPLKFLSMGQIQWLALTVFFEGLFELLIFDETLRFLDKSSAEKSMVYFDKIANSGKTLIAVSHDMEFIKKYCTSAIWLDNGCIRRQGEAAEVVAAYEQLSNNLQES
ncbi:MAG: ATP-binding cassette domain-containing protein [Candidatus Omnitrophota bacterium]